MADSKSTSSGGIGFAGALFITFLVLKLTHVIAWSWLWVTAPLWGGLALALTILLCVGVFALGAFAIDEISRRRRR